MKNMCACCAGGLTFWAIGWGLAMGNGQFSTPYNGTKEKNITKKTKIV